MLYYVDIYVCYRSYLCIVNAYTSVFHTQMNKNMNKVSATKVDRTITICLSAIHYTAVYIEA